MAGKNINCIYNENGPYCSNSNLPKAFKFLGISFGPRMCHLFDKNNAQCYLQKQYPRPKINKQRSEKMQEPIELILGDGKHRFSQTITNDQNPTLVISYAGEPAEIGPELDADETLGKTDDKEGFIFKDPRVFMQFTSPASVDSLIKSLFDLKKLFKEKTSLEDAQEWLSIWLKAKDDVIQGKSCHIARDHWVTRAHMNEIEEAISFWQKKVKDLKKVACGEMEKG